MAATDDGDRDPARASLPDPLRVLWLIKGLGPGGAETLLVNQARANAGAVDYRAAYLLPHKDHLVPVLEEEGVQVSCLEGPSEADPRWVLRLRALLRDDPVDVVHAHSPYVAALARLAVRSLPPRQRPAVVYTEHNRWPRYATATRWANRLTYGLDEAKVAVSDDVRDSLPEQWHSVVEVLVHGVHLDSVRALRAERPAVRAELGIGDDEVVIGTVANLVPKKDYPTLLAAAAEVVAADPRVRYVAVGQGPLADEVAARRDELGLGDRFTLLGYRPDATRIMTAFDVFTLASRHEGLPVALMDALALGLPVVATAVGGVPEAVAHEREALLVPAGDAPALAAAHLRLAGEVETRAALAAAAAGAADAFDVSRANERLVEIYERAAARRAARRRGRGPSSPSA